MGIKEKPEHTDIMKGDENNDEAKDLLADDVKDS